MKNLTKLQVFKKVSDKTGLSENTIRTAVEGFKDVVLEEVPKGNTIQYRGWGTFRRRLDPEKKARDISRGLTIIKPERYRLEFKFMNKIRFIDK